MVEQVGAHVAERADTPIDPSAPVEWVINRVVLAEGCGSEEDVPVEICRLGKAAAQGGGKAFAHARLVPGHAGGELVGGSGPRDALRPDGAVGPDVDFVNGAKNAGADPLDGTPAIVGGVSLVAHLRDDARSGSGFLKDTRLAYGPRERFLDVDVLSEVHCVVCGHGVEVVRSGDDDGVDVVLLVEHTPEVAVAFSLGVGFGELDALRPGFSGAFSLAAVDRVVDAGEVDVGERDDVLAHECLGIGSAHVARAYHRDVEGVAWCAEARTAEDVARHDHDAGCRRGERANERAPGDAFGAFHRTCEYWVTDRVGKKQNEW